MTNNYVFGNKKICTLCIEESAKDMAFCLDCGVLLCYNCYNSTMGAKSYILKRGICHKPEHKNIVKVENSEVLPEINPKKLKDLEPLINPAFKSVLDEEYKLKNCKTYIVAKSSRTVRDCYFKFNNRAFNFDVEQTKNDSKEISKIKLFNDTISHITMDIDINDILPDEEKENSGVVECIVAKQLDIFNVVRESLEAIDLPDEIVSQCCLNIRNQSKNYKRVIYTVIKPIINIENSKNFKNIMNVLVIWCEAKEDTITSENDTLTQVKNMSKCFKNGIKEKYKNNKYLITLSHAELSLYK